MGTFEKDPVPPDDAEANEEIDDDVVVEATEVTEVTDVEIFDTGPDIEPDEDGVIDLPVDPVDEVEVYDYAEVSPEDVTEEEVAECSHGDFECLDDGSARRCVGGTWEEVGACFLGCDASLEACYLPSNISAFAAENIFAPSLTAVDFSRAVSPVYVNGDTGSIVDADGATIRDAGAGMNRGIYFSIERQAEDASKTAGVFMMESLTVPSDMTVIGVGSNPLILVVREGVDIYGTIDVGARRDSGAHVSDGEFVPGPGGFSGGNAGTEGLGDCAGGADGGDDCFNYTTAGGGGGGFGGSGGHGGDGAQPEAGCTTVYFGGEGGGLCGGSELRPLIGGSGGGGGGEAAGGDSVPGEGGAGGGALQITSLQYVHIHNTAVITAAGGGGGGGRDIGGGGGGGGAAGAILIESVDVMFDSGGIAAANGGGGGAGDCT